VSLIAIEDLKEKMSITINNLKVSESQIKPQEITSVQLSSNLGYINGRTYFEIPIICLA